MKKMIFIFLILAIFSYIIAQELQIDKIGEIAYAQTMTGSESVKIVDDHLYYLTSNGLEIYEINIDGSITKISILNIANSGSMIIKDQFCFLISGGYDSPYLIFKWLAAGGFHYDFYSIPELEYIGQVISDHNHRVVNDNLLLRQDGLTFYIEQYNPPDEFEVIGVIDVSAYSDGNYAYEHFKVINETILSAVNSKNITFWDISDVTNWQYLSRYTLPANIYMFGNRQYSIIGENAVIFDIDLLRLLDISDITNPVLVDSTERTMTFYGQACDNYDNNLYVSSSNFGIQHYSVENNNIEHSGSYYDHKRFYIGDMYNDKIIASNISTGLTSDGYTLFNINDPLNPVDLGECFNGKSYWMIHKQGGWMVLYNGGEYTLEIYDITDLENPILRNTLTLDDYGYLRPVCRIDESDPNTFYLWNYQTNMFWKFDISEPGEPVELFEYEFSSTTSGLTIINSLAYVAVGTSPYDLLVLDGLDENEPYIANEIYNFSDTQYLDGQDNYLVMHCTNTSGTMAQIFQLDNPLQPEQYFTSQWGLIIEIRNDLIFSRTGHIVAVYENRPNSTEPIAIFNGLNYINNIELMEHNGINYLFTMEMANIGLFEYTYVPSSANDELPKPEFTLSNYPNPFNPETKIVFDLSESGQAKLVIYNIKGQKVKTLLDCYMSPGRSEMLWNSKDDHGKRVSSGIYFYRLQTPTKILTKKMLLMK
jgi:hypothetical protein